MPKNSAELAALRTLKEIRRENLRFLAAKYGGVTKLATLLGYANGTFLSQLTSKNPSRTVSDRVARRIEAKLDLYSGWLDIPS